MSKWLGWAPKALASRAAGKIAAAGFSRALIPAFARHYRVDLDEAEYPVGHYRTLAEFFTRRLKPGARPIAGDPNVLVSPADATVGASGEVQDGELLQAKGRKYPAAELLGDAEAAARLRGGSYVTLYLAPKNYHRVHAPESGVVRRARYIPGARWPVNAAAVSSIPKLFAINERLATWIEGPHGELAVVMVGACLVGGIQVAYDPGWRGTAGERIYDSPRALARGEELGCFQFGSTVVLLIPAGGRLLAVSGQEVRVGEPVWKA